MNWTVRRNRVTTMTLSTLDWALAYQKNGFAVYPLVPGDRIPLKGSHGYKDATRDPERAKEWWGQHPAYNIGLSLVDRGILVLDIDRGHASGSDGVATIAEQYEKGMERLPDDTYIEHTPRGGLHYFLSYPKDLHITANTNLFASNGEDTGVDYNALGVPVSPSQRSGGQYKPVEGRKLAGIRAAPNWVLTTIQSQNRPNVNFGAFGRRKTWAGKLLDEMVIGAESGQRNSYLTKVAGKMFYTGADPKTVYNLLLAANEFMDEPLPDREVNTIFKSVLKREETKYAR